MFSLSFSIKSPDRTTFFIVGSIYDVMKTEKEKVQEIRQAFLNTQAKMNFQLLVLLLFYKINPSQ